MLDCLGYGAFRRAGSIGGEFACGVQDAVGAHAHDRGVPHQGLELVLGNFREPHPLPRGEAGDAQLS
jgi:hypothetical protein